jgi:hypothetical protein
MFKNMIKKLILKFFDNIGYKIVKKSKLSILKINSIFLFLFSLHKENKKVIQMGANDENDLTTESNKTHHHKIDYIDIVLQKSAFIKFKKNYVGFENFNLSKACVGKAEKSSFFYLNENYKNIDLLKINAEGYDYEVIYNSNLNFSKPSYVNFECKNLNKIKLKKLINFLISKLYDCLRYRKYACLAI